MFYFKIDIRDYDALYKICAGVDVIYHTASYGMSGPEQVSENSMHLMRETLRQIKFKYILFVTLLESLFCIELQYISIYR